MTDKIDTTGDVTITRFDSEAYMSYPEIWFWDDLDPFTQGYVEALFAAEAEALNAARIAARLPLRRVAFRDLAPETLARIIADCEERVARLPHPEDMRDPRASGRRFWDDRQLGCYQTGVNVPCPPPLTVQLGDDGKVVFA